MESPCSPFADLQAVTVAYHHNNATQKPWHKEIMLTFSKAIPILQHLQQCVRADLSVTLLRLFRIYAMSSIWHACLFNQCQRKSKVIKQYTIRVSKTYKIPVWRWWYTSNPGTERLRNRKVVMKSRPAWATLQVFCLCVVRQKDRRRL